MKKVISVLLLAFICAMANAQVYSIGASGTVYGQERIRMALSKEDVEVNKFCPVFGGGIFYEKILSGAIMLVEGSYITGKLSEHVTGAIEFPSFMAISAMVFPGLTIFPNKRFQIPVYVGIGYNFIKSDLLKSSQIAIGAKVRMKLYVTDNVGIFIGGNWKGGYGTYKAESKYDVFSRQLSAECGLVVSL